MPKTLCLAFKFLRAHVLGISNPAIQGFDSNLFIAWVEYSKKSRNSNPIAQGLVSHLFLISLTIKGLNLIWKLKFSIDK